MPRGRPSRRGWRRWTAIPRRRTDTGPRLSPGASWPFPFSSSSACSTRSASEAAHPRTPPRATSFCVRWVPTASRGWSALDQLPYYRLDRVDPQGILLPARMQPVVGDERRIVQRRLADLEDLRHEADLTVLACLAQDRVEAHDCVALLRRFAEGRAARRDRVVGRRDAEDPVRR